MTSAPCIVCGNQNWHLKYQIGKWSIKECRGCAFAAIDPFPTDIDERSDFFSENPYFAKTKKKKIKLGKKISSFFKSIVKKIYPRDKYALFSNKLRKYLEPRAKFLDVACADGAFIKHAKKWFDCSGIDISEDSIHLAKQSQPDVEFMLGDYVTTEMPDKHFDGITMISLIEHLPDPLGALEKSYKLLNENGVLILKTVNYECLNRKFMRGRWVGFRPPDHMIYFTPKNLEALLKKVGFRRAKVWAQPLSDSLYCDAWK